MHAIRVPVLGIAIAMAVLCVENVGALVYREHVTAQQAKSEALRQTELRVKQEAERALEIRQLQRQIDEITLQIQRIDAERVRLERL